MKKIKFKTNIKCMGCVNTVKPHLEKVEGLDHWEVDLNSPERIMTVSLAEDTMVTAIQNALVEAGYAATEILD
ncbi:MAG: cation transporter [Lewinellaceae bacterium]|nr:cation transporter [Lewinellaceae bacterium]